MGEVQSCGGQPYAVGIHHAAKQYIMLRSSISCAVGGISFLISFSLFKPIPSSRFFSLRQKAKEKKLQKKKGRVREALPHSPPNFLKKVWIKNFKTE